MSWATRRRFSILLVVGATVVAFTIIVLIATFYKTPSCTDGVANQDETGIDCGGSCPYLCTALEQPPTVLFAKVLDNGLGRIDVIASIQNKNVTAAAKNIPYSISLYGTDQSLVREINGTLDLPAGSIEPIYISGVAPATDPSKKNLKVPKIISAFFKIEPSAQRWFVMTTDPRIMPTVLNTTHSGTPEAPLIEAVLANPSAMAMSNVRVVVFVRNADMDVIAASETIVPIIPAQGQATATFTWNSAFSSTPASIEIMPIISMP